MDLLLITVAIIAGAWGVALAWRRLRRTNRTRFQLAFTGPQYRRGMPVEDVCKVLRALDQGFTILNREHNGGRATVTVKGKFVAERDDEFGFDVLVIQRRNGLAYIPADAAALAARFLELFRTA